MREFRKFKEQYGLISVVDYYEADNHLELLENYKNNPDIMGRGSAPSTGGPVIAFFYEDKYVDEYVKFKNEQINGKQ